MAAWIARKAWKRIPWRLVWAASLWLVEKGRERMRQNLDEKERRELRDLMIKSKGRPSNLRDRDRARIKSIAGKAFRGG